MKRLLILGLLLLFGQIAAAQTVVNLTVQDTPDNQLWNNGTWAVKLQQAAGNSSQTNSFTLLSGGGSLAAQSGVLSASATAAITLPANANIGPLGTVWQYTVCPQASAGCFQFPVTVTTSSPQTLVINPPSIRINLTTATPPISAYSTGEINGAVIGSQFYLLATGLQVCSAVSGNSCTTWSSGSGASILGANNNFTGNNTASSWNNCKTLISGNSVYALTGVGLAQALSDAGAGGTVCIAPNTTVVVDTTTPIAITQNYQTILCSGQGSVISYSGAGNLFNVSGSYLTMKDCNFTSTAIVSRASVSVFNILSGGSGGKLQGLMFTGAATINNGRVFNADLTTSGTGNWLLEHFRILPGGATTWTNAIFLRTSTGTVSGFTVNNLVSFIGVTYSDAAIVADTGVDTLKMAQLEIGGAGTGIFARNSLAGQAPRWIYCYNCEIETSGANAGIQLDSVRLFEFIGGQVATAQNAFNITGSGTGGVNQVSVIGANLQNISQHCVLLAAAPTNVSFTSNTLEDCGVATNNTYDYFNVAAGSQDFHIDGNHFRQLNANKARYGVNILAGASNAYTVNGNDFFQAGIGTVYINDLGTGTNKCVWANTGGVTVTNSCGIASTFTAGLTVTNGAFKVTIANSDGGAYSTLASAIAACPTTGCVITALPGIFTFSSTVALTSSNNGIDIECSGASWKNNGVPRGPTTLRWTGGASPMFTLNTVNGFKMKGCDLDNAGTATEAIQLTVCHDCMFDGITIDPGTAFTTDAVSCQNNANANVRITFKDSFILTGAPFMLDCNRTNIFNSINTLWGQSTGASVIRIGNTSQVINFNFTDSDCESLASAGATHACIDLIGTDGASITGSYFEVSEGGNTAGQLCWRIGNSAYGVSIGTGTRCYGDGFTSYGGEIAGSPCGAVVTGNTFTGMLTAGIHVLAAPCPTSFPWIDGNVIEGGTPVISNPVGIAFANLGTPANGVPQRPIYCPDCTIANPCAGAGTGAFAKRLNGVWVCN
jgi:hypothetical protein